MKEWKNPKIYKLGIEDTLGNDKLHYCHKLNLVCEIEGNHGNNGDLHGEQKNWKAVHKDQTNPHDPWTACCCYES